MIVTGACLLEIHGKDIDFIRNDGFYVNSELQMFVEGELNTNASMVKSLSKILNGVTDEIVKFNPDLVLTGFDIGANFATTIAAAHMNIPVAHIQGGEVTGTIDDSIRHAMSKFAHIHFPATEDAKNRLIRMGEKGSPTIPYSIVDRTLREFLRFLGLNEYKRVDIELEFLKDYESLQKEYFRKLFKK